MIKRFLSMLVLLMAVVTGAWADEVTEIVFTGTVTANALAADATFTVDGSTFSATIADDGNKMEIDADARRFGTSTSYKKYTHRLRSNGASSSSKNYITLNIPEAGKLRIAPRTGSDNATDRKLVITQGETELYNEIVQESQAVTVTESGQNVKVYPYVEVDVTAGSVRVSYTAGMNFYSFGFVAASSGGGSGDDWTDIIVNGSLEGTDRQCFFVKENALGSENVYYARIQDGSGKDGSRGIVLQSTGEEANSWDTQFYLRLPYELPAGTKYRLKFDYKADNACKCDLQAQNEPGEYIIWYIDNAQGSPACNFGTDWATYDSGEITVPADCNGKENEGGFLNNFQTIAFNLSQNQKATTYYIDNIKLEILTSVASGLTESPAPKALPQYPVAINSIAIMGDFLGKGDDGNWNTANAWALTQDATNNKVWTLTKEFTAEAKTYDYKLFANGNMSDFTYPVEEKAKGQFVVSEAGQYNLKITASLEYNVVSVYAVPVSLSVTMKDGTQDAKSWTITSGQKSTTGDVAEGLTGLVLGDPVTLNYSGRLKVKSVKATVADNSVLIPVAGIALNKKSIDIEAGQTETLSLATVLPDYATDKSVTWTSSDEAVATVDQTGKVTAVAMGNAVITATANDGSGVKAECAVTVYSLHIDLSTLTGDVLVRDGAELTGTLANTVNVRIAPNATVTLNGVNINGDDFFPENSWKAGLHCNGDATIILAEGTTNTVRGSKTSAPGLSVSDDYTMTIQGNGTLNAYGGKNAPGIGGWAWGGGGSLVIAGGTINAYAGTGRAAGIGTGEGGSWGNITITGGTVTATGGTDNDGGAGIGTGNNGTCGDITITSGSVTANGNGRSGTGIGGSFFSKCGNITITDGVTMVKATRTNTRTVTIGLGYSESTRESTCGTVTIGGTQYYDGAAYQNGGATYLATNPLEYQP